MCSLSLDCYFILFASNQVVENIFTWVLIRTGALETCWESTVDLFLDIKNDFW